MLNRFFGTQCARAGCGHHNPKGSEFCEKCGISLGFSRPAILDGNRWSPAPDEMAAFFKFRAMQGFFTKALQVPPGMKAWVLQGDDPTSPTLQLDEGEHTTETLFQRLNNFFRSPHGEVLVVRTDASPVELSYPDVLSAELLQMQVAATMMLSVGDVHAFRRRFMLQDGVVTTANLADILRGPVRQALAEVIGARHVDEMAADPQFRDKLDAALRKKLEPLLADLGLALMKVSEITLFHEALDQQKRLKGRLWLLRREMQTHDEHERALDEIYDQRKWAEIKRHEAEIRRRRHEGTLSKEEADIAQTLRLLDQEKYQQIADAQTREHAIRMGAADAVHELESEFTGKRRQREQKALGEQYVADDEVAQWRHVQELARIRRESDLKLESLRKGEEVAMERERIDNALEQVAARAAIERAKLLDNEAERQAVTVINLERLAKVEAREQQLESARSAAAEDEVTLSADVRRQESRRVQAMEDALLQAKLDKLKVDSGTAVAKAGLSEMEELIRVVHVDELNTLDRKLMERRGLQQIEDERLDKALQRDLKSRADQRESDLAKAGAELQRMTVLGSLPVQALVALADQPEKFEAHIKVETIKLYAGMSPEQLKVVPGATLPAASPLPIHAVPQPAGPAADEQFRLRLQEERAWFGQIRDDDARRNSEFLRVLESLGSKLGDVGIAHAQANVGRPAVHPASPVHQPPPAFAPAPQYQSAPGQPAWQASPEQPVAASAGRLRVPVVQCRDPKCGFVNIGGADFCGECRQPLK